ncbi:LysR family transcriptional regulator [Pusillimonas sp. TS35]|uniref:LysR family transcriptional regulator n=1 Tax=Paracandidimonas lactea TaxID=2895524 RepID=UPI001369D356|nr:LysR family transcriptional regulator [Paracandidimonas lactea]MYN12040.1 LysR family transcriptional regulator [Pusillimonas sp. TS35]
MNIAARHLRAFVALCEEKHFSRAAARCHQTQPAFSALIRTLEEQVGARLFDRSTRKVELTREGERLLETALRVLRDIDDAVGDIRDRIAIRKGRVAIAALPSLAAGWLPDICAQFHAAHPGVDLILRDALLEPCLALVRAGAADFAVAAMGREMAGLAVEPLCEDAFYLVCRDDHHLAGRTSLRLADLAGCDMIQLGQGSSVRQSLAPRIDSQGLRTFLEVDHLATVTGLVAAGLGVSLVPGMTLFQFRHPRIRIVPLASRDRIMRALYLIRRQDRSLPGAAQAFYDVLLARRSEIRALDPRVKPAG